MRRLRFDLLQVFKIVKFPENYPQNYFQFFDSSSRTRGHSRKIIKERCRTKLRQDFFANRVIKAWNALPQNFVSSPSLESFRSKLTSEFLESIS